MKPIVNLIHYDSHSLASTDALLIFIDVGLRIERIRQILKNRKRLALWLFFTVCSHNIFDTPWESDYCKQREPLLDPWTALCKHGKSFFQWGHVSSLQEWRLWWWWNLIQKNRTANARKIFADVAWLATSDGHRMCWSVLYKYYMSLYQDSNILDDWFHNEFNTLKTPPFCIQQSKYDTRRRLQLFGKDDTLHAQELHKMSCNYKCSV